uniref:Uncharacterized protein n=1 Tax=Triticum urartu TaxID=4572 RepID=A0A8R7TG38_TRIUA
MVRWRPSQELLGGGGGSLRAAARTAPLRRGGSGDPLWRRSGGRGDWIWGILRIPRSWSHRCPSVAARGSRRWLPWLFWPWAGVIRSGERRVRASGRGFLLLRCSDRRRGALLVLLG